MKTIRPVCLLSNISKMVEKILLIRLRKYNDVNKILNNIQYDFRHNLSTTTTRQLVKIRD